MSEPWDPVKEQQKKEEYDRLYEKPTKIAMVLEGLRTIVENEQNMCNLINLLQNN